MGSQDEYLRNFCILLTDRGVVPLTDPLQIAVYNSLLNGMKRPSDLTSELNLSSSSLHFIIDKMAESGIIDRIKPESDKKTVYYLTNARLLANSTETNEKLKSSCQNTFVDPLKNYKGLSSLSNMLDYYMSEIGVDIDPLRMKYADALADSIGIEKKGMEDAILDVRDVFSKLTGYNFTVYSFSPLTLVFTGDEGFMDKVPVLTRFLARLVEDATGRAYKTAGAEYFNGSDTLIKVVLENCERSEEPYMNTSLHSKDSSRFLMVDVDGTAGLMTSDVQIDIIDAIYERPLCITDIVNRVDSPRSTITSNLLRMVEEGVISVFYSESGSAYYGLACSILLKKSRPISSDNDELNGILDSIKDKEGSFLEGQLLYTLAYLKKLGFDSEYVMVVLGAKYMRTAGSMDAQGNFDAYFGKMSDIAQAIGLSLNIVSIYPLTIGITSADPDSNVSHAMTFIKGMAHQGLEMASSGIFVRSCEDKEMEENISFKEIYPALSMKPVKGVMVENLSASPTSKKRTSSVKTALLNRSRKDNGQSARTVRYITAAAFLVMLSAILIFSFSGSGSGVEAKTCELTLGDGLEIQVYDSEGDSLSAPYNIVVGSTVVLKTAQNKDIGYVSEGIAYLLEPSGDGQYSLTMDTPMHIEELYQITGLDDMVCSYSIYCSSAPILNDSQLQFISSEQYKEKSGSDTIYLSYNNKIYITANDGYYVTSNNGGNFLCDSRTYPYVEIVPIPTQNRTIDLGGESYYYRGQLVTGSITISSDVTNVELRYAGDKNVVIRVNGDAVKIGHDNSFSFDVTPGGDIRVTSEEKGFY